MDNNEEDIEIIDTKWIDDFEKEVLERYHIPYKESRRNGEKYRGWVGIQIKSKI